VKDRADLFIDDRLSLGEGPIWHPGRGEFIWFDINAGRMFRADQRAKILGTVEFGQPTSAAAIIDDRRLAVVTRGALLLFDIETEKRDWIVALEEDMPGNRPNDSRVDPAGGFWIGTMGRKAEPGAGAYYHFRAGHIEKLYDGINIPNSTCFSPDGRTAYFAGHEQLAIKKVAIDKATGRPIGKPEVFVEFGPGGAEPDGSVVDSEGFIWNAEYGGGRVVRYSSDGRVDREVRLPVSQVTCPCLGGPDLRTMFITSAHQGLSEAQRKREPLAGSCFVVEVDVPGLPESALKL
jgi:sugar lactone lactonase YvrE